MRCKRCNTVFSEINNVCPNCRKEGYNLLVAEPADWNESVFSTPKINLKW